jgi:SpoVK/Ycf46/Vps4 family AAA+-type ATPase
MIPKHGKQEKEITMINFDEEIKKFQPAAEMSQLENNIYENDFNDVADVLIEVMKQAQQPVQENEQVGVR